MPFSRTVYPTAIADRPDPRVPFSRRTLMIGGVLASSLGLAACDGQLPFVPRERALVTLTPMTTAGELVTSEPVLDAFLPLSPTEDHPLTAVLVLEQGMEKQVLLVDGLEEEPRTLEIDPASTGILVDDSAASARVYTRRISEGSYAYSMHLSTDLQEWTEVALGDGIDRSLAVVGSGLAVGLQSGGSISVWEVAEDGAVTALEPIPVAEGHTWTLHGVARVGDLIVVLAGMAEGASAEVPSVVSSSDGGASWGEPVALPTSGDYTSARVLRAVGDRIVAIGEHDTPRAEDDGRTYTGPTAWSTADGAEFAQEEIPKPAWGIDGFQLSEDESLEPDSPVDFINLRTGSVTLSPARDEIFLAVSFVDDCRVSRRNADGSWSTSDVEAYISGQVVDGIAGADMVLSRMSTAVVGQPRESDVTSELATFAVPRELAASAGAVVGVPAALVTWTIASRGRSERQIYWETEHRGLALRADGDRLELAEEVPSAVLEARSAQVFPIADGAVLAVAEPADTEGNWNGVFGRISVDGGDWEDCEGLPGEDEARVGLLSSAGDRHYLPVSRAIMEDSTFSHWQPEVYASEDGRSWERIGDADLSSLSDGESVAGANFRSVQEVDGVLVAMGLGWDEPSGESIAVTAALTDDVWTVRAAGELGPGSSLTSSTVSNGQVLAEGSAGGRSVHVTVAADGTVTEVYRSTDEESRGLPIDLGDGALIAGGWIRRPATEDVDRDVATGVGLCIWASRDAGEIWDVTMVPAQEGRFPGITLQRDGEGLLVLVDDADAPHGYRIADAGPDVLGEDAEG